MKSFSDFLKIQETVNPPRSEDEKRFMDKHVVGKKDHPVAKDDQFVAKKPKAKRQADLDTGEDEEIYEAVETITCEECGEEYEKGSKHECEDEDDDDEDDDDDDDDEKSVKEEMSDKQMKKREEIVKSMKDKLGDFKKRYGDRAKEVMYATATKMAMKEEVQSLIEAVKVGPMKLKDGSTVKLTKEDVNAITGLFNQLSSANKKKMEEKMIENKKGFEEILTFAREAI